jgi:hypothetical protein
MLEEPHHRVELWLLQLRNGILQERQWNCGHGNDTDERDNVPAIE